MLTTFALVILLPLALVATGYLVTAYFVRQSTPDLPGDRSSQRPSPATMPPLKRASIERSPTSSTVLITVRAEPDPPVVFTEEPVSGQWPLQKLTVLYVPLLDGSDSPTPRFVVSGSTIPRPPIEGVDDPKWTSQFLTSDSGKEV